MPRDTYYDDRNRPLNPAGEDVKRAERRKLEGARRLAIALRRLYVGGNQYDARNEDRAKALKVNSVSELAEHEKLHAYSTHIQESIDYIATQMAESFELAAKDPEVDRIIKTALRASPDLRGSYGQQDVNLTNMIREALVAQDTPVHVRWDPVKESAWCEFWDSEQVEFVFNERDRYRLDSVVTEQSVWVEGITGEPLRRIEYSEYRIDWTGECIIELRYDEDDPHDVIRLGVPFIPWVSVRAKAVSAKDSRGVSAISEQALRAADRFNAVEQVSYLIARYNSHGNIVVVGDAPKLQAQLDERINKDVADILTFPGGTGVHVVTLPTDPQMLNHQREVLTGSLFSTFGLTRVDHETVVGLGDLSGYALEILNRKSDGTFNQIRNQYVGDFKLLLDMILDVTAYKADEDEILDPDAMDLTADPEILMEQVNIAVAARLEAIDPLSVFPEARRVYEIHLGSGYVVDRAQLREDYVAGLISRAEYLRQTGHTREEITKIEGEIEKDKPKEPEGGLAANAITAANAAITATTAAKGGSVPAVPAGTAAVAKAGG